MNGYLDTYGAGDAKREKRNKFILIGVVTIAVTAGLIWYFFRDYKEEARVREFLSLLDAKEYKSAYALWGCTDATPCRDYAFDKFLEDWGPSSDAATGIRRSTVKSCNGGIIQVLQIKGQDVNLFVDRATRNLGFAPWPVCKPRIKM